MSHNVFSAAGGGGDGDGGGSGGVTQFPPWAMAIIIIIILAILGTVGGIVIMCAVKKPWKNDSNGMCNSTFWENPA